jgi:hypothetical protein
MKYRCEWDAECGVWWVFARKRRLGPFWTLLEAERAISEATA